jgi:hypothetical protein
VVSLGESQGPAHLRRDDDTPLLTQYECGIHAASVTHMRKTCHDVDDATGVC